MKVTNLLTQLVIPVNLAIALILVATLFLLLRRIKRAIIFFIVAVIWVLFWSIPASSIWLGGHLENQYPYLTAEHNPTADAIVVLGGHTANNRTNWFEDLNQNKTTSRVERGAELYKAQKAPYIVVSGAALDGGTSEAQGMARFLRQQGIPESAIILEEQSFNTKENAMYSAKQLRERGATTILLVTSALHTPRSVATFQKENLHIIAAPVAPQITRPNDRWYTIWQPSYQTLNASRSIIKEYVGLLVYWLRGWV